MKKIAILTQHPSNKGGVLELVRCVHSFCKKWFDPIVFFIGFDPEISAHIRPLKTTSEERCFYFEGMKCIEVGARWAFFEPGHHWFLKKRWAYLLRDFDYCFVVNGTSVLGHVPLMLHKKYVMWLASGYDADRVQRVQRLRKWSYVRYLVDKLYHPLMKRIERKTLQNADFVFALSEYTKGDFIDLARHRIQAMNVCNFPMAVKTKHVDAQVIKQKNNVLVAVARYDDPRNNAEMLIRVFKQVRQRISDAELYILGNRPAGHVLEAHNACDVSGLHFVGEVTEAVKYEWYQRAKVVLITAHQSGLGIVGLEAFSCGVPVIATDCGGPSDYIDPGENGYLVGVDCDQKMTNKIIFLLEDNDMLIQLSRGALQTIKNRFTVGIIEQKFQEGLRVAYPELNDLFLDMKDTGGYDKIIGTHY